MQTKAAAQQMLKTKKRKKAYSKDYGASFSDATAIKQVSPAKNWRTHSNFRL